MTAERAAGGRVGEMHVPLLELNGKRIKGLKRCENCGLSETYWSRWPKCESKSQAKRIEIQAKQP